ncbi:MAG: DUF1326 domain-containing protein [Chloroflexota bacterium]|nr:DUF1326 domain-containing protein [Chloroflexota bacterium]
MVTTAPTKQQQKAVYQLEGTLLEVCSCGILCPCWVGEDPDGGECFSFLSHSFKKGQIDGIDVSGLSIVSVVHIPGNVLAPKSWKLVMFIEEKASPEQRDAIQRAYTGQLGGPLADLAGLVGEVLGVEYAPIEHEMAGGKGTLRIKGIIDADMEPYRGGDGTVTTLRDSIFSTVPGSPAWVGKASKNKLNLPKYGMAWDYTGRNAIQSEYKMEFYG